MVFPDQKTRKGTSLKKFGHKNLLLTPDGGVWKTLKINGKKWLLANTTSKVDKYNRIEPSMFIVFDNKTVMRNTSLFIPKQKLSKSDKIQKKLQKVDLTLLESDDDSDYEDDASSEELMVREILTNLQLLKEQEKLALLGDENGINFDRLDNSVEIILVDKVKDKDMMKKIKDLEDGEMILMDDDDYGSSNDHSSNVHARHTNKYGNKKRQNKQKSNNVIVKKKPRRRQRVKLKRGFGNKVRKVYITY